MTPQEQVRLLRKTIIHICNLGICLPVESANMVEEALEATEQEPVAERVGGGQTLTGLAEGWTVLRMQDINGKTWSLK